MRNFGTKFLVIIWSFQAKCQQNFDAVGWIRFDFISDATSSQGLQGHVETEQSERDIGSIEAYVSVKRQFHCNLTGLSVSFKHSD